MIATVAPPSVPTSPLTGGDDVVVERRFSPAELRQRWRDEAGVDVTAELSDHTAVLRCRCLTTGLRFFHPPTIAGGGGFYQQLQRYPWYYAADRWEYGPALAVLPPAGQVLEVGSGSGEFLQRATAAGHRIRGIELNPGAVTAARARGLACDQCDLAGVAATAPGAFDAVCSFQVLEHVADPRAFISHCLRLLRPGGLLVFSVPDADGWIRLKDFLLDLPPHHMLGWSERTFRAAGPLFGLGVERVMFEPLPESQIENYLSAQSARWRHPVLRRLLFNRFTLPVLAALLRTSLWPAKGQSMLVVYRLNRHD